MKPALVPLAIPKQYSLHTMTDEGEVRQRFTSVASYHNQICYSLAHRTKNPLTFAQMPSYSSATCTALSNLHPGYRLQAVSLSHLQKTTNPSLSSSNIRILPLQKFHWGNYYSKGIAAN